MKKLLLVFMMLLVISCSTTPIGEEMIAEKGKPEAKFIKLDATGEFETLFDYLSALQEVDHPKGNKNFVIKWFENGVQTTEFTNRELSVQICNADSSLYGGSTYRTGVEGLVPQYKPDSKKLYFLRFRGGPTDWKIFVPIQY